MTVDGDKCVIHWKSGGTSTIQYDRSSLLPVAKGFNVTDQMIKDMVCSVNLCVVDEENQNLSMNQNELLKWHFKLGCMGLNRVQQLGCKGYLPKHIANVAKPWCSSCQIGAAQRRATGNGSYVELPASKGGHGHLKAGDCVPGQRISVDHYES